LLDLEAIAAHEPRRTNVEDFVDAIERRIKDFRSKKSP